MTIYLMVNENTQKVQEDLRRICPDPGMTFLPDQGGWIPVQYAQTQSSIGCSVVAALSSSEIGVGISGLTSSFPIPSSANPARVLSDIAGITVFDTYPNTDAIQILYDVGNLRGCNGRGYWVQGPSPSTKLTIWIAAFIPIDIPGLTKPVPGAPGKTMFDGPPLFGCFFTDHRTFSNVVASSRIRSLVEVDTVSMGLTGQAHDSTNTISVDCDTAAIKCDKKPDTSDLKVADYTSTSSVASFSFSGGGSNPCVPLAPEINWDVKVKVELVGTTSLAISVLDGSVVEPFPAFEMYVTFNGETKTLFTRSPDPGATPWNLVGDPNKAVTGSVTFSTPSIDGKIDYPTDVSLFHELINAKNLVTEGFSGGIGSGEADALAAENQYRASRQLLQRVGIKGGCNDPPPTKPGSTSGGKGGQAGRGGSGCFIATATLEGEFQFLLDSLRDFRDTTILSTRRGRELFEQFYDFYYSFSPSVADALRQDGAFKEVMLFSVVLPAMNYLKIAIDFPETEIPSHIGTDWYEFLVGMRDGLEEWSVACMPPLYSFPLGYTRFEVEEDCKFVLTRVLRCESSRNSFLKARSQVDCCRMDAWNAAASAFIDMDVSALIEQAWKSLWDTHDRWLSKIPAMRSLNESVMLHLAPFAGIALGSSRDLSQSRHWLGLAFALPLANYFAIVRSLPTTPIDSSMPPEWASFISTLEKESAKLFRRIVVPRTSFPSDLTQDEITAEIDFVVRYVLKDSDERNAYRFAVCHVGTTGSIPIGVRPCLTR